MTADKRGLIENPRERIADSRGLSDADNSDEVDEIIATNIPPEERGDRGQMKLGNY